MVSGKTSEELPSGWKECVKVKNGRKIKYFTNSATGQKFYSKKSVIRFVNSQEIEQGSSPSTDKHDNGSMACNSKVTPDNGKTNESPEWLPRGWTVECRTRKSGSSVGSVYKIYTDPYTGCKFYSKPQVMQYLQGIEDSTAGGEQQLQKGEETLLKQQDIPQHGESVEGKICLSGENKNESGKCPLKDVEENNGLDELPPVHTQEINTRKRGHGLRKLQQDTSQASESLEDKNHISRKNENDMDKPSPEIDFSDAQEKNGSDELPRGWIKEIKTRKRGPATRKDPYYIDTASGYVFRSKKDVMRYLETGDIHSCVIKPRKRDTTELKLVKEDTTHPSTPHDENESEESADRRQLYVGQAPENGKECSGKSSAAEAEKLKDEEGDSISEKSKEKESIPTLATKLTASTIKETPLGSGTSEGDKTGESSGSKAEGSKQETKTVPDNVAVKSTETHGFHEQEPPEKCLDAKTKKETRKFKERKLPSMPGRSSKRLAGHDPEMLPNFSLTERALRAAARKPREVEADRSSGMVLNTVANEVCGQPVTEVEKTGLSSLASSRAASEVPQRPVTEAETTRSSNLAVNTAANEMPQQSITEAETVFAHHTSVCAEASLETDLEDNPKAPSENQVLQQATGQLSVEENPMSQGDYWSDPCWDFAFKTLTGAIPLEDTLSLPGCFPQQTGTSYTQENLTFGLPEFEIPPIFQNDVPQADPVQNNVPADQSSTNPTFTPPGNSSLPGCSSQPPSLDARSKDYETKVKS